MASSLGWAEVDSERKLELPEAICDGRGTRGRIHVERGSFLALWHGRAFTRMRAKQRDVLLTGGRIAYRPGRFQVLSRACSRSRILAYAVRGGRSRCCTCSSTPTPVR